MTEILKPRVPLSSLPLRDLNILAAKTAPNGAPAPDAVKAKAAADSQRGAKRKAEAPATAPATQKAARGKKRGKAGARLNPARLNQARAQNAQKKQAVKRNFEATQAQSSFEVDAREAKRQRLLGPGDNAYVTLLRAVATKFDQGPVLPRPDNLGELVKQPQTKTRAVLSAFLKKTADYLEFATSMQAKDMATEALNGSGAGAPEAKSASMDATGLAAGGAAAAAGAAAATASAAGLHGDSAPKTQAASSQTTTADANPLRNVPTQQPDGRHTLSDLTGMSYASLGDGPNVFKLIMLMMNEKRMERTFMLMMEKQLIETELTKAQIAEMTTQMFLVAGGVYMDRVMAEADYTQSVSQMPNMAGKTYNKDLTNNNPTIPEEGLNAWSPAFQHQGRAPAAEERAANWIKTVSGHPGAEFKYETPPGEKPEYEHDKDKQYLFTKAKTDMIERYNTEHPPEERILTETFPGSGRHLKVLYFTQKQLDILKKMDKFGADNGVELNLHNTYVGDESQRIQGIHNDLISNRRDDFPGHQASRDEDYRAHEQAAAEAEAHAKHLDATGHEDAGNAARAYARAHAEGASRSEPRKLQFDAALRTSLTMDYNSMELKAGKLENLQLGSVQSANRTYYDFIDRLKPDDANVRIQVLDEQLRVRESTLTDLQRRAITNHRALAQKMHVNTHPFSAAGDDYKQAAAAVTANQDAISSHDRCLVQLDRHVTELQGKTQDPNATPEERNAAQEKLTAKVAERPQVVADRAKLQAAAPALKSALEAAKRNFAVPSAITHRERRFRTGEAQLGYHEMMRDRAAIEAMPLNTAEQKQAYGEKWFLSQATEDEFKLNSPPHQTQMVELFHHMASTGRPPSDAALRDFDLVSPKDMQKHCKEAFESASATVEALEAKQKAAEAAKAEGKKAEELRGFEKRRLTAARSVADEAQKQHDMWKNHAAWSQRKKPGFLSPLPERNERAAKAGRIDLSPAPAMLKPELVDAADGQGKIEVRLPKVTSRPQYERTEYKDVAAAGPDELRAAIKSQVREDLDHGHVDMLDPKKRGEYLDALESGGRMAIKSYHDKGTEGAFNAQVIANFMTQLQDPFRSIQEATAGDSQNASMGAAGLADDASNSVTSAFASNYDQIHAMITRLNSMMNSFSGF